MSFPLADPRPRPAARRPLSTGPATPAEARVDLAAIRHNVEVLRRHARGAEVMATVKADGYGHGMLPAARAALEGGGTRLGTALVREALDLRAAGVTAPVLSWLITPGEPL